MPTTRATVVLTDTPIADDAAGREWLRSAGDEEVARGVRALNAAVRAHRLATADPTVHEVSPDQALVVRIGYGAGEEVAYGNWREARALGPERRRRGRRASLLRPAERLAALLSSRESALVCEELILRARLDVDHERFREAALQLEPALAAALVELDGDERRDLPKRRAELAGRQDEVAAVADAARHGDLDDEQRELLTAVLGRLEALLRARAMAGENA